MAYYGDGSTLTGIKDTATRDDVALLGFKVAANGSLARYNLVDQSIDAFEDASGVDASASTGEYRNSSGNYYSGTSAATGGTITTDGGDTIHTFTADGVFGVGAAGDVELLVVGGGGGAGGSRSGGGGAGGYRTDASFAVTATTYPVTVGDGGAGGDASPSTYGTDGGDSIFSTITSTGGGGGANGGPNIGRAGGSGGGGAAPNQGGGGAGGAGNTPSTSPSQGNSGGGGSTSDPSAPNYGAGGGGGSSGAGTTGQYHPQGTIAAGGAGTANSISGASVTYAAGGAGGNTANPSITPGADGAANTGNGGVGAQDTELASGAGGAGGSGVVIVKFTTGDLDSYGDMSLVSNAITAESVPTTGDLVMTYTNGAGTATINTDIKAYITRDGSDYTTAVTLVDQGDTGGHTILTANGVDLSGETSGTSMRWKIETLNQDVSKQTRIHAVSLGWS